MKRGIAKPRKNTEEVKTMNITKILMVRKQRAATVKFYQTKQTEKCLPCFDFC